MASEKFLIIDDHPLFVEALQSALEAGFANASVSVAHSMKEARALLDGAAFDLILLDLRLPDVSGLEGIMDVRTTHPKTPLAVISAAAGADVVQHVMRLGANGFIPKGNPRHEIISDVQKVLSGTTAFPDGIADGFITAVANKQEDFIDRLRQLTPQQFKVLSRICEAKLNKQIAFELGVTETTIKAHITLIFKKLGVHSRTQAVLEMQKLRAELDDRDVHGMLRTGG